MSNVPTIEELAAMRKELDGISEKIATAKGTFSALETQRVQYEAQLRNANVEPENAVEALEQMKEGVVAKYDAFKTLRDSIKADLAKAEEGQDGQG